ncbi:hypothetical protein LZ30DRAFT_777058 [Colletotrichum cereale]|nr:hypothetical protein LZ30DRAFT_777058 [Colletotrichum cereale]
MAVHTEGVAARPILTSEKPIVDAVVTVKPVELKTATDLLLRRPMSMSWPTRRRRAAETTTSTTPPETSTVSPMRRRANMHRPAFFQRYTITRALAYWIPISQAEVVALLANSDLNYVVSMFALSRMGFAVLYLSTRLSPEAYVNLLRKTDCDRIVTADRHSDTAAQINAQYAVSTFNILDRAEHDLPAPSGDRFPVFSHPDAGRRIAFIVHSSGSTGLPKPIFRTHLACISNYTGGIPYRAFLTLPLFHNHGIATLFRAVYAGYRIAVYNANLPLSGTTLVKAMAATESGQPALRTHRDSFRDPGDKYWNYMRLLASAKPWLRTMPIADGVHECVILDGLPSKVMSNSDDPAPSSYRTLDTFVPHPAIPDAWRYLGRLDDRVTLVNGEKVLPIPPRRRGCPPTRWPSRSSSLPASWTFDLLRALRDAGLEFRIVSQREWVRRLRASDPDPERNPTYKLLGFFEAKYDNDGPGRQGLAFETDRTGRRSPAVGDGWNVVGSGLVERMVRWMETQW